MKLNLGRLLDNKRFLMFFSLIAAFISWLVVVSMIYTEAPHLIQSVPVDMSAARSADTALGASSLEIVDNGTITVDVVIEGPRSIVGGVKPSQLLVTPDLSGITRPGTYRSVRLNCRSRYDEGFTIKEIKPEFIELKVDRYITRKFVISTDIDGLQIPEDDYLGAGTIVSPREVEIYGPESTVSKISHCVVSAAFNEPLTANRTVTSDIVLYDSDGNEIPQDLLTLDTEQADITVQVLKQKRLPVKFDFLNVPSGLPVDLLDYRLTQGDILVAGPESVIDSQQDFSIGYVDMKEVTPGFAQVFDISLPEGFINVEDVRTIGVTFENEDMLQASYTVSNLSTINVPVNYTITINTQQISGVTIVGDPEVMNSLSSQDIVAVIDLSERDITPGPYRLPVHISIPGRKLAWAIGDYTAVVTIKEK